MRRDYHMLGLIKDGKWALMYIEDFRKVLGESRKPHAG